MNPTLFANVIAPYIAGAASWIGPILNLGGPLFWIIAGVEMFCIVSSSAINHDLVTIWEDLVYGVIGIGIAWVIFLNWAAWGEDLWSTFGEIGGQVSGLGTASISPDAIMLDGQQIFLTIWTAVGYFTWLTETWTSIAITLAGIAIFLIFLYIAIVLMMLQIEAFVAIIGGGIFLPFAVLRFTAHFTTAWLGWIFGTATQLFFTLLVLSIALPMVNTWIAGLTPGVLIVPPSGFAGTAVITTNILVPGTLLAQTLVLWALSVYLPRQARKRVEGAVTPYFQGLGGAIRTGMGVDAGAGAMISGAPAAAGAISGAVDATIDAMLMGLA